MECSRPEIHVVSSARSQNDACRRQMTGRGDFGIKSRESGMLSEFRTMRRRCVGRFDFDVTDAFLGCSIAPMQLS